MRSMMRKGGNDTMRILRKRRGQSTAEYAIVIALVLGAVIGMQTYVRRGLQGRVQDASNSHLPNTKSGASGLGTGLGTPIATFGDQYSQFKRGQFEPYYASSTSESTSSVRTLDASLAVGDLQVRGKVGDASSVKGGFKSTTDRSGSSAEAGSTNWDSGTLNQ